MALKQDQTSWIGRAYFRAEGATRLTAYAACFCSDRAEFEALLGAYLSETDKHLLWTEEVFEAVEWFGKFGHNGTAAGLARKVDEANRVAISQGTPWAEGAGDAGETYLIIEEYPNVEPLDQQFGAWPKLTVPSALQDAIFGQPEPTEAEREMFKGEVPPMRTYAVLDAAKWPYMLVSLLETSGLKHQSLFQGAGQEEYGDHAPYLVELQEGNEFTQRLFTKRELPFGYHEKGLGTCFRSRASFAEFRNHLRKFTKVQSNEGDWYFFRFWDPLVHEHYMKNTASNPERIYQFYRDMIASSITYVDQTAVTFTAPPDLPATQEKFLISQSDYQTLSDFRWLQYKKKLLRVLEKDHADALTFQADEVTKIAEEARAGGFTSEIAVYNYTRSKLFAETLGVDFQALCEAHPEGSGTERARDIWYEIQQKRGVAHA